MTSTDRTGPYPLAIEPLRPERATAGGDPFRGLLPAVLADHGQTAEVVVTLTTVMSVRTTLTGMVL